MAEANTLPSAALMELQMEQRDLIETVDKLRSLGVADIVDLPQIIVVGDQSSGKSSVLEAISQQKFPSKDDICTRFATQLSLRQSASRSVKVTIETNGTDQYGLPPFDDTEFDNEAVAHIIEAAKKVMSAKIGQDGVSEDILHIEVTGPDMVTLTLVDLPGFYNSPTQDQSAEGIDIVERLADRYMAQKASIILVVISGKYDIALQTVHNRVLKHDPQGLRTMGIITKADFIRPNSHFLTLARNEEPKYKYALGWHVLRNRTEDEGDISNAERDANEEKLFQSQIWQQFPQKNKGIKALRQRLGKALYEHIKKSMPRLVEEIRLQIKNREAQLERLGPARSTPQELRQYLTTISKKFERLADDAIRGHYMDDFFNGPDSEAWKHLSADSSERIHKLRALVRDLNMVFYEVMVTKGHSRAIIDPANTLMNSAEMSRPPHFPKALQPWLVHYDVPDPQRVPLQELMELIDERATINRGTEFPGSTNDGLAVREFKNQSSRWKDIATSHIDVVTDVSQCFVEGLLTHIIGSDSYSYNSIMTDVVYPFFDRKRVALVSKLEELLRHYKYGDPQPLEPEFRAKMEHRYFRRQFSHGQNLRDSIRGQDSLEDHQLAAMMDDFPGGRNRNCYNSGDVLEKMMIHYEMSLRIFTDNIIILAIENCLICDLPSILEPNMVNGMADNLVEELVAERPEVAEERELLQKTLTTLREGLRACRRHRVLEPTESLPPPPVIEHSTQSENHLRPPSTPLSQQRRRNVSSPSSSFSPPSEPIIPSPSSRSPLPGETRRKQSRRTAGNSKTETIRRALTPPWDQAEEEEDV